MKTIRLLSGIVLLTLALSCCRWAWTREGDTVTQPAFTSFPTSSLSPAAAAGSSLRMDLNDDSEVGPADLLLLSRDWEEKWYSSDLLTLLEEWHASVLPQNYLEIREVEAEAGQTLLDLLQQGKTTAEAAQEAANWVETARSVVEGGVTPDGSGVWFKFTGGQGALLLVIDASEGKATAPIAADTHVMPKPARIGLTPTVRSAADCGLLANSPGYLCLEAFINEMVAASGDVSATLGSYGYAGKWDGLSPMRVSDLLEVPDYSFCYICSHGGLWAYGGPVILTGEQVPAVEEPSSLAAYAWATGTGVIHTLVVWPHRSQWYYAITPMFVTEYMSGLFNEGSVAVLDACYSAIPLASPAVNFVDAFTAAGAGNALGWQGTVEDTSAVVWLDSLVDSVCPSNLENSPKDLRSAWIASEAFLQGKLDLVGADPAANLIPIVESLQIGSEGEQVQLVVRGCFGTEDPGQILVLPLPTPNPPNPGDPESWQEALAVTPDTWSSSEARYDIPVALPYGEAAVRVRANGVLSNVKRFALEVPPSGWEIGSYRPTFKITYGFWIPDQDILSLHFMQDLGVTFPWATITVENASALQLGIPAECGVAVSISDNVSFVAGIEPDLDCSIQFSRLELKAMGRVSGTIAGMAGRAEEPGSEPVRFSGSFSDVVVQRMKATE